MPNLLLTIGGGVGYIVGGTQPTHQVALTPPPPDANFVEVSSNVQAESGEGGDCFAFIGAGGGRCGTGDDFMDFHR